MSGWAGSAPLWLGVGTNLRCQWELGRGERNGTGHTGRRQPWNRKIDACPALQLPPILVINPDTNATLFRKLSTAAGLLQSMYDHSIFKALFVTSCGPPLFATAKGGGTSGR